MGRKPDCNRKKNDLKCRNLSYCQREYLEERAAIATINRGYVVSQSAILGEIVAEKMRNDNFNCDN